MFTFSYDPDRVLLHVVQKGYWTIEEFNDFERELERHHHAILRTQPAYRIIADCREYPVQSAEVSQAFETRVQTMFQENNGRCAIVVASALGRMQARRVLAADSIAFFAQDEWDQAMAWLQEDTDIQ